jgi:hypothetical protein
VYCAVVQKREAAFEVKANIEIQGDFMSTCDLGCVENSTARNDDRIKVSQIAVRCTEICELPLGARKFAPELDFNRPKKYHSRRLSNFAFLHSLDLKPTLPKTDLTGFVSRSLNSSTGLPRIAWREAIQILGDRPR